MTNFAAGGSHPLLSEWYTSWVGWDEMVWASEARLIASRAQDLACNDPFIAAVVLAHINGKVGPTGLRHTSHYDDAPQAATTSAQVRALRRQINAITAATWNGTTFDAENIRSRIELERALAWSAFVLGDGFAVRLWNNGRSTWRLIQPDRVRNPTKGKARFTARDGGAFDGAALVGIYVDSGGIGVNGIWNSSEPVFVPLTAPDGTPNVIHATGYRLPGMWRGVSRLAPMVVMQRQLGGVLESHVAAKRLQAILGLIVEAQDGQEWKSAMDSGSAVWPGYMKVTGPLNVWVKPPNSKIEFTTPNFQGADLEAYLKTIYRTQCASLQMPVDVVLCQMGEASLSSARAGLDQWDRTCQVEQEAHIAQVAEPLDRTAVADALATGFLVLPTDDLVQALVGKYSRPPKYSTDRLKDANTIKALVEAGVSETTAYAMFGLSWEDEQETRRAQAEFQAAQGLAEITAATQSAVAPVPAPAAEEDPIPSTPQARQILRRAWSFLTGTRKDAA